MSPDADFAVLRLDVAGQLRPVVVVGALAGLRVFSETYQAAADQPDPLFRRRVAREAA